MFADSDFQSQHNEMERYAYNAAFHELGFHFYWDHDTYERLLQRSDDASERVRQYLEAQQPHLLRAYDSGFLVEAVEAAKRRHVGRSGDTGVAAPAAVDWAQMAAGDLGA